MSKDFTTNPLKIPFPTDPQGICGPLKTGALKTITRIQGDDEKQDRFLKFTGLLVKFSKAKHAAIKAQKVAARENAMSAAFRTAEKQRRDAEEKVAALRAALLKAEAALPTDETEEAVVDVSKSKG